MQKDSIQNLEDDLNVTEALRQCASCSVIILEGRKISSITPEAARLTGLKVEEALQKDPGVLPDQLQKILSQTLSSGQPVSAEIKLLHQNRGEISIYVTTNPVLDASGQTSGAITVLTDFSCAEKLEQKIGQIDRLASIGTLSASMAHEIKNALVAVRTFMDLLLSRQPEDDLAGIVGREMTRIDSIVSQMLTFSGPAKPVLSPLRLHDVLNHSLRLVQHQIGEKNIQLERSFAATPDIVKGDDYQLKQAFLNLLLNALEATPSHGKLIVATKLIDADPELAEAFRETNAKQMRVTIQDSGAGISAENLSRVFEPFFTTKPKGTGLGLPITRRIINEHRGTITVMSEPKKGAMFCILFPMFRKGY